MTRLQRLRQARSDAIKPAIDAHRQRVAACCPDCGCIYAFGFTIGCERCADRAHGVQRRVREGQSVRWGLTLAADAYKVECADELQGHGLKYDHVRPVRAVA